MIADRFPGLARSLPGMLTSGCKALLGFAVAVAATAQSQAAVPNPVVEGPIAVTSAPGSADRNYIFMSTDRDLKGVGYVEQEFFFSGTANRYSLPAGQTGTIIGSGFPYKSRMVVRRPADPKKFNGVVVLEWTNVTSGSDQEFDWLQTAYHLTRAGYAHVAVSAQRVGVNSLRSWNPSRYGSLNVDVGGTVTGDALAYDIYSQAAQAVSHPTGVQPLGDLQPKMVLAIGQSQSANQLAIYINGVHPLHNAVDALILNAGGSLIRTDLDIPVWKVMNETETEGPFSSFSPHQPDTDRFRLWEVAGASHSDWNFYVAWNHLRTRDFGPQGPDQNCALPSRSRIPVHYVLASAIDQMVKWARDGVQPPIAPRIQVTNTSPPVALRDSLGNALGGIRLAEFEVPTAKDTGGNAGASFCVLRGSHEPFSDQMLASLYPSNEDYVTKVRQAADAAVSAGYILEVDGKATVEAATRSIVGKALVCGDLCRNVGPDMTSISKFRDQTAWFDYGGASGKQLVRLLETALEEVAMGDTVAVSHRPTAAMYYGRAVQDLNKYIRDVTTFKQNGTIQAWTADYLLAAASALVAQVEALSP